MNGKIDVLLVLLQVDLCTMGQMLTDSIFITAYNKPFDAARRLIHRRRENALGLDSRHLGLDQCQDRFNGRIVAFIKPIKNDNELVICLHKVSNSSICRQSKLKATTYKGLDDLIQNTPKRVDRIRRRHQRLFLLVILTA